MANESDSNDPNSMKHTSLLMRWAVASCLLVSTLNAQPNAPTNVAIAGIDSQALIISTSNDPKFQAEVRAIFPSLTEDSKKKISACLAEMRNSGKIKPTSTILDPIIAKHMFQKLGTIVQTDVARQELRLMEQSADLQVLIELLG